MAKIKITKYESDFEEKSFLWGMFSSKKGQRSTIEITSSNRELLNSLAQSAGKMSNSFEYLPSSGVSKYLPSGSETSRTIEVQPVRKKVFGIF